MTPPYHIDAVLSEDGKLSLDDLPFHAGQSVAVTVSPSAQEIAPGQSLRGTIVRYDRPTDPVSDGDWDAAR